MPVTENRETESRKGRRQDEKGVQWVRGGCMRAQQHQVRVADKRRLRDRWNVAR